MMADPAKPKNEQDGLTADGLTQRERFERATRELECHDDPERFKDQVRKVAKAPPPKGNSSEAGFKG